MICDSKCCRHSGEKIWCKKNLGLKAGVLLEAGTRVPAPVYSEYSTRLHKNEVMSG